MPKVSIDITPHILQGGLRYLTNVPFLAEVKLLKSNDGEADNLILFFESLANMISNDALGSRQEDTKIIRKRGTKLFYFIFFEFSFSGVSLLRSSIMFSPGNSRRCSLFLPRFLL
jgi:hypothetical protein